MMRKEHHIPGEILALLILLFTVAFIATIVSNVRTASAAEEFKLNGDAAKGKPIFDQYCVACHGTTGQGNGPAGAALNPKPRDFHDKTLMLSMTEEHIYKVIRDGGISIGKSPLMAPWKGTLTDQQVRDTAAYVKSFSK
jgi:mono/diheme cytochrome c family protein